MDLNIEQGPIPASLDDEVRKLYNDFEAEKEAK